MLNVDMPAVKTAVFSSRFRCMKSCDYYSILEWKGFECRCGEIGAMLPRGGGKHSREEVIWLFCLIVCFRNEMLILLIKESILRNSTILHIYMRNC